MRDSAGVAVTTILGSPDDLPEWELGDVLVRIDGSPRDDAPYLRNVRDAFWLEEQKVVVVDPASRQLHLYDRSGAYIESFGGEGEGPSEFTRLRSVTRTAGDTIVAYDAALRTLKLFHPRAGFVRSFQLPEPPPARWPLAVWPLSPKRFVRHAYRLGEPGAEIRTEHGTFRRRPSTAILTLLAVNRRLAQPVMFPGSYSGLSRSLGDVRLPFSHMPLVFVGSGRILFGSGRHFELTALDSTFTLRRRIRWPSLRETVGEEEIARFRDQVLGPDPSRIEERIAEVMFADAIVPRARPALSRVLTDPNGRIWISRFEPLRRYETLWYVLDARGVPLARLSLPRSWRAKLTAVAEGRLMIVTRNAYDVPSVRIMELVR